MSKTDHLAKAKDYLAKGEDYYRKAADEIIAWLAEDHRRTQRQAADVLDMTVSSVNKIVQARTNVSRDISKPYADLANPGKRGPADAKHVLKNASADVVLEIARSLPAKQLEALASAATDTLVDRHRAERAEHKTEPTTRELMGGDKFDPSEFWADTLVIRINRNAREIASLIQRAGGLLYGSMTPETAFEYLHEAEGMIAEARAAAQEQVRDGAAV